MDKLKLPPLPFPPLTRMEDWSREPVSYWTQEQVQTYASQAQRMALEEAAQFIERAQVRMKLPGNQAFCIYDANMAEEVRKLTEGL